MKNAIKFFEEEITRLENAPKINGCEMTDEWAEQIEICKTAKSAIEKQIPKKLKKVTWIFKNKNDMRLATESDVLTKDNHITINHCPCCDEQSTVVKYLSPPRYDLYCRKCGQALDWSDTK